MDTDIDYNAIRQKYEQLIIIDIIISKTYLFYIL